MFVGLRIAEIGEHAVAHIFGDEAALALDAICAAAMIGGDDRPHVLGIEQRRQRRRADEVAKHNRELAALGGIGSRALGNMIRRRSGLRDCGGLWAGEFLDRRQYRATMPDGGDAKLFEVFARQLRQYLSVDFIVAKSGLVLLQAEAAQPIRDVHTRSSNEPGSMMVPARPRVYDIDF